MNYRLTVCAALLCAVGAGVSFAVVRPAVYKQPQVFSKFDEVIPGVVIIKFKPGVDVTDGSNRTNSAIVNVHLNEEGVLTLKRALGFVPQIDAAHHAEGDVDLSRIYFADISSAADPRLIASRLGVLDEIEYAEPKYMNYKMPRTGSTGTDRRQ